MSDAIERTRRQDQLKGLIEQLHAGEPVETVKAEFAELLEGVGSAEIARLEQALIAEGLPETEVKRLCDVHVAVFRESLDAEAAARPDTLPGHPVHTFRAENEVVARILTELGAALAQVEGTRDLLALTNARETFQRLRAFEKHYLRKENLLFPYLEKHDFAGPSSVMWAIHDDIRAEWKALAAALGGSSNGRAADAETPLALFGQLDNDMRQMIYKEENILFPAALERLSRHEWAAIHRQENGIGYFFVEPGLEWLPVESVATELGDLLTLNASPAAPVAGMLSLETGALTAEQVNLLLTHLPVEITFVDEHDRVRYYSESKEMLFPRSPAIIGRQVQNCHPPASLDRVQQILDSFRAGSRDVAEFWIQMRGHWVYIRYFALRDAGGAYRGTLEVTQEIGRIRELEGERRLVDEASH